MSVDLALKRDSAEGEPKGAVIARGSASDQQGVARLFSHLVGDAQSSLKCAGRTARLLEEQFIADGWPTGQMYGCESTLAERYGVGRAVVREAARILEARGTARMRRGRHGGLELTSPSVPRLHEMTHGYCCLVGISREQVKTARRVLDRVAAYMATERGAYLDFVPLLDREEVDTPTGGEDLRRMLNAAAGNAVVTFFSDCVDQLRHIDLRSEGTDVPAAAGESLANCIDRLVMAISRGNTHAAAAWAGACSQYMEEYPDRQRPLNKVPNPPGFNHRPDTHGRDTLNRTRAAQIVHDLMRRIGPEQWTDGRALGHELELCERYGVDRGVMRQAIRIMEAADMAASVPGRGHGLVARSPGPASVSRLLCCHFAARRVGHHESFLVFKWLGVEMVALAARSTGPVSLEPVRAAIAALVERRGAVLLSDLIAVEERQFALARNPVLDLFLRGAKAFPALVTHGNLPVPSPVLRAFVKSSAEVTAAIEARNPLAAAVAQERKFTLLKRNIDHFFVNFRGGSLAMSEAC
jgi:DNA-binding FadR family transcriptional regulator